MDVGEAEVPAHRIASQSLHRIVRCVFVAGADQVDAQKAPGQHVEVVAHDVLNDSGATDAGLHIDAIRVAGQLAVFDPHVADAAGGFTADANAGKTPPVQGAFGNEHVFRRLADARTVQPAAGFKADGIVARINVAAFNADVLAGINVNAITTAVDVHVFDHDIGAVSGVSRPIAALRHSKTFPANVIAGDGFKDDRATGILRCGDGRIPVNATRPDDASVVNIRRIDKRAPPRLPAPFPADIEHRVIIGVRAAGDDTVHCHPEDGAVADLHAADEIVASRHKHFAATGNGARIERLLEGDSVFVRAIADRAKIADVERKFRCGVSAEKRDCEK